MSRIVICSPPHAGTRNQALGIAEALNAWAEANGAPTFAVRDYGVWDPWRARLVGLRRHLGEPIVLSCGSAGERKARRMKMARPGLFWTHVETLKHPGRPPDLNVIPAHDWVDAADAPLEGRMRISGVPHRIRASALAALRAPARRALVIGKARLSVFLIGGPNDAFEYDQHARESLRGSLVEEVARANCLVVVSRRTPSDLRRQLTDMPGVRMLEDITGLDYPSALAAADRLFVTEDSISMSCEATATGRPVFRLALSVRPGPRLEKFRRFQAEWVEFIRPTAEAGEPAVPCVSPPAPNDADRVARRMVAMIGLGA